MVQVKKELDQVWLGLATNEYINEALSYIDENQSIKNLEPFLSDKKDDILSKLGKNIKDGTKIFWNLKLPMYKNSISQPSLKCLTLTHIIFKHKERKV